MTKLLGVVGSLRRNGNTHILVSRILDGARTEGATGDIPSSTIWIFVNTTAVTLAGRAASAVRTKIKNENMTYHLPEAYRL